MLFCKKALPALVLAAALLLAAPAGAAYVGAAPWETPAEKAASAYFPDMSGGWAWAAGSVDLLYEKGIVSGVDGGFAPAASITRGDLLLLILRCLDLTAAGSGTRVFRDVDPQGPYGAAAETACAQGIITGDGGLFYPYDPITREDAFTLLYRAALAAGAEGLSFGGNLSMFRDATQVAPYARAAAANLVREGLLQGAGGLLRPREEITRAEAAVLLCRLMRTDLSGGESIPDAALPALGLSRAALDGLLLQLDADAAGQDLGPGSPDIRPYYAAWAGERLQLYASLYLNGSYSCAVFAQAEAAEDGSLRLVESSYSFG